MEFIEAARLLVWTDSDFQDVLERVFSQLPTYILEDNSNQFIMLASLGAFRVGLVAPFPHDGFTYMDSVEVVDDLISQASALFPIYVFDYQTILRHHLDPRKINNTYVHLVQEDHWHDGAVWREIKRLAAGSANHAHGIPEIVVGDQNNVLIQGNSAGLLGPHLSVTFDFPPNVAPHCRAYLEYFTSFLKDIGIDATSEISSQTSDVLFSVTPSDPDGALSKIQEALAVYLKLPSSHFDVTDSNALQQITSTQLASTVEHLRGQLAIEASKSQLKDALLMAQGEIIATQRQALNSAITPDVLLDSIRLVSGKKDDEPILGELVKAKSLDWLCFKFNLPAAIRMMKKKFSENQDS